MKFIQVLLRGNCNHNIRTNHMDQDDVTPAALYFEDDSFVLAGTYRDSEAMLWLSFYETDPSVNFAVYDYLQSKYTYEFKGNSPEDVQPFIQAIEKAYGVKIPSTYASRVEKFMALKDEAFGLDVSLDKERVYCDSCGDMNGSDLKAFYFPPLNDGEAGSLAYHWNYGCFGGQAAYGTLDDEEVLDEVRICLARAANDAEDRSAAREVKEFLSKLGKVTSEK
jgi:hypothetical protein